MSSINYIPALDGLRAIAVMLVLIFHFELIPGFEGGFMGVDIFFVISGFLITSILLHDINNNRLSLSTFYKNRVARLAPALLFVVSATLLTGYALLLPSDFVDLSEQSLSSLIYVSNFYYWKSISYFELTADKVFLLHTWSLSLEEQFYLVFPVSLIIITKYAPQHLGKWILIGCVLSFLLNILQIEVRPSAVFYLLPARAWELLTGSLVAVMCIYKISLEERIVSLVGVVGIVIIILSSIFFTGDFRFPGYFSLLPVVGTAMLVFSLANRTDTFLAKILALPQFSFIGKISYSLYLIHWPINVFAAQYLIADYAFSARFFMFLLSIVVAFLIHKFVESPFRLRVRNTKRLSVVVLNYSAVTFVVVAACISIKQYEGLEGRFPPEVVRAAKFTSDSQEEIKRCINTDNLNTAQACRIGDLNSQPSMIIMGDSHALAAYSALDLWLKENKKSAIFTYKLSCPPLLGSDFYLSTGDCIKHNVEIKDYIAEDENIESVFLVSVWGQGLGSGFTNDPSVKLSSAQREEVFKLNMKKTTQAYKTLGKTVIVWAPLPGAPSSAPIALAYSLLKNTPYTNTISTDEYMQRKRVFYDGLNQSREWIDSIFYPHKVLCDARVCRSTFDDQTPVYHDSNHLTKTNAAFWADMLNRQI